MRGKLTRIQLGDAYGFLGLFTIWQYLSVDCAGEREGWKVGRCCVQWAARYVEDVKCYLFIEGLIKIMR